MSVLPLFQAIQNNELVISLGQANHLYGALAQLFHITGLIAILAPILLVNLRLLGFGLTQQPIKLLAKSTNSFIIFGLISISLSGLFMLAPSATLYYPNPAFWWKMELLLVAIIVQFTLYRKVTQSESASQLLTRVTAITSLFLWFGVAIAGRIIGYVAA